VADVPRERRQAASDLLSQLARELSTLVRREVEVAASERLPTLRRALLDAIALAAVAVAALFALAALSVAGGRAAAGAIPGWAAALLVAGGWALVAGIAAIVLLRPRAQPRERDELFGLLQMLSRKDGLEELQSSWYDARAEAEQEVRQTSAALVEALLDEAIEHQVNALPVIAKREVGRAEADAAELIAEGLALLTAPARAGLSALGRLVEPPARETTRADERPPRTGGEH
jgi:Putative Actinobacterial Holin-X, holin superfamily III